MTEMNQTFFSTRHKHISSAANKKNVGGQTQASYQNKELKLLQLRLYDYFHYMTKKRDQILKPLTYLLLKRGRTNRVALIQQ